MQGGIFIWMKFLGGVRDYDDLLEFLLEEKVAPAPGEILSACLARLLMLSLEPANARIAGVIAFEHPSLNPKP